MNPRMENPADTRLAVLDELLNANVKATANLSSERAKLDAVAQTDLSKRFDQAMDLYMETVKYLDHANRHHKFKEYVAGGKEKYAKEILEHTTQLNDTLFHLNEQATRDLTALRERIASASTNENSPVPSKESDAAIMTFRKNQYFQVVAAPALKIGEDLAAAILDPKKNTEEHHKKMHDFFEKAKTKFNHLKDKAHNLFHPKKENQPGQPTPGQPAPGQPAPAQPAPEQPAPTRPTMR